MEEAMRLFVEKNISAAPIVDESGEPVGLTSDGDILKRLSPRSNSFTDPIVLIKQHRERRRGLRREAGEGHADARQRNWRCQPHLRERLHANLTDVCRVLSENHLKKVPVLEAGPHRGHHQPQRHHPVLHGRRFGRPSGKERAVYCG